MNPHTSVPALLLILQLAAIDLSAQQPSVQAVPRPQTINSTPRIREVRLDAPPLLSSNYRVTFSGTGSDNKTLGELSTLTCSSTLSISGPLSNKPHPAEFRVEGQITENEGQIVLTYAIGFSVPNTDPESAAAPNAPGNVQYATHSSAGTLRMQMGKAYEVLKSGGHSYTISINAESDK
jgi:hypothetical protein